MQTAQLTYESIEVSGELADWKTPCNWMTIAVCLFLNNSEVSQTVDDW